jgi:hypothetical protein
MDGEKARRFLCNWLKDEVQRWLKRMIMRGYKLYCMYMLLEE